MLELTRETFVELWSMTKAGHAAHDADLQRMQKFMRLHEDMHDHFERIAQDPSAPLDVDGENLPLHIAMDVATEKALEQGDPPGLREVMQRMLDAGADPGVAFHALSQAMTHEFLTAAADGREMTLAAFLARATAYAAQVRGGA